MEKYCVSQPLAERLKKAGYPQDTLHRYYIGDGYEAKLLTEHDWNEHFADEGIREGEILAAPLSDEILERLPIGFTIVTRFNDEWVASWAINATADDWACLSDSPANALASLWLELKENVLLEGTS